MIRILILSLVLLSLLTACAAPAYTPDAATLAEREQAEYETRMSRATTAWYVGLGAVIILLAILCGLVFFLAQVRYKVADADAARKVADNRRLDFISLGDGKVYDIRYKTVITTGAHALSEALPIMPVMPLSRIQDGNPYCEFVRIAANSHPDKWNGKTIPRFDKMGYRSPEQWMKITRVLVEEELIVVEQGKETVICNDQTLGWLYNLLTHSPIEA